LPLVLTGRVGSEGTVVDVVVELSEDPEGGVEVSSEPEDEAAIDTVAEVDVNVLFE
jgi:hypothetical protein